ncbi:hypothetical protein [Streptomyces sp. NPDC051677]|uniref:hypothetical protein n=1 Tax=Streptomyces sp. NPDC051677 TaxID=3365669 RepID=UPI0037D33265
MLGGTARGLPDSTQLLPPPPRPRAELVEAGCATERIVEALDAEGLDADGFRPPKRCKPFTKSAVKDLLRAPVIQRPPSPSP